MPFKTNRASSLPADRPTETFSPVPAAVAGLIIYFADLDSAVAAPLAIAIGFAPAAITWVVTLVRDEPKRHGRS